MRIYVATIDRGEFFEVVKRCAASSRQAAENRMGCGPRSLSYHTQDVMTARQAIRAGAYDPKGLLHATTIFK